MRHDAPRPRRSYAREWRQAAEASNAESDARRARVLAHPDLAKRLMEPPFSITDPARWNGWIPPRTTAALVCGHSCGRHGPCTIPDHFAPANDSHVRKQLVDIAAEALRREQQPALDETP